MEEKNANLNVFENICETIKENDVILSLLVFDHILLGNKLFSYQEYSYNPDLVRAVEQLLICYYKDASQCEWNRTPSGKIGTQPISSRQTQSVLMHSLAEEIRNYLIQNKVNPSREKGLKEISFRAGDIHKEMGLVARMPSVCEAIDGRIFQSRARLELITRKGPGKGANVIWVFSIID